ncbi:MAG: DNA polymerase IV [Candidatus Micrarchaeales archaeon]|nr:DNA polymerase IV [Candidatus Micrarchaeales archaeon]
MDSFYASCEELRHPELKGKPFIVGSAEEENKFRGVVETASYAAKKLGVRSAMPVSNAMKVKGIIYVPSDHDYYDSMSVKVMSLLKSYGYRMETLSIDEAALDLGEMGYQEAENIAKRIKKEINMELGLPCTLGICRGKVLAKIVCDSAKPDGLKLVKDDQIIEFLKDKEVDRIPGVGPKTAEKLAGIGIKTIGDLAKADFHMLNDTVGSFSTELMQLANGIDSSKIIDFLKVLSIGRERTLESKTKDLKAVDMVLDKLAEEVIADLLARGMSYKTITVKAKYSDFTDRIRSKSLANYTDSIEPLISNAHLLIKDLVSDKPFRKVGVKVSSLTERKGQKSLF